MVTINPTHIHWKWQLVSNRLVSMRVNDPLRYTPVTLHWRPYCVLTATQVAVRTPQTPEGRSKDARGRSEDAEYCSGREPTATTLNMFKVVAEVRRFTTFC
ncbi:hypothetical protein DPMN_072026 [Dreissena polymorpha]|uniref:Uncharacterized protein n=1 Tax=Dreissena polymorpha TaxID=45954 RepID=A0A9D3Z5K1_DREPO|nr:hypothetical protein DPMN_072026 [Dreissena polymorpha]